MKIKLHIRMRSFTLIASVLVVILGCLDSRASYIQALENKAYSIDTEGLLHAVSYGYYADAKMLLEAGVSPDSVSSKAGNHMPPLVKAAIVGDDRIITLLLEYKADINAASQEGLTPLLAAINANNLSSAILLLNAKPDLSVVGPKHAYSALHTVQRRYKGVGPSWSKRKLPQ